MIPRKASVDVTGPALLWGDVDPSQRILIVNRDLTHTVYIGDGNVSVSTGLPVPPLGSVDVPTDHDWWAVGDTAGAATVWAVPGGGTYTPSPSEQAAQVSLAPGSQVSLASGSQVIQASGASAGTFVIPDITTTWSAGATSGTIIAGQPGKHIVLIEMTVAAGAGGAGGTVIQDSAGGAAFNLSIAPTATPLEVPCNNISLPAGASLVWSGGAGFGQSFGGLISYKVV